MQLLSDYVSCEKSNRWFFVLFFGFVSGFLSVVDNMLPHFLPWIKWGFASSVSLVLLALRKYKDVWLVFFVRWFLGGVATGRLVSLGGVISLGAGALAIVVMMLFSLVERKSLISFYSVSVAGAIAHNTAQLWIAGIVLDSPTMCFLKMSVALSVLSGLFVAFISRKAIKEAKKLALL